MKAFLNNYRQSPRKVRLLASLLKGKSVSDALVVLNTSPKFAALPLKKLLESAVANAKSQNKDKKTLFIKDFRVDSGVTMKRGMPRARGSAYRINKRTSLVTLVLEEQEKPEARSTKS
jgi:large subunit ribosomal protein L22